MYGEILKFGAMIVDELDISSSSLHVYTKWRARGGAWVVWPTINEARMEMYADEESRGGILSHLGFAK